MGLSAGYPAFIMMFKFVDGEMMNSSTVGYAVGGAIYIFGALLYVCCVPERFMPGKFDIFGSSH